MDVFATIADAVGVPLPQDRVYDSHSMLPLLTGQTTEPFRNTSFFYQGSTLFAMRHHQYKAHLITQVPFEPHAGPELGYLNNTGSNHEPYGHQNPWLLFDVEKDPGEMFAITGATANVTELLSQLADVVDEHNQQLGVPPTGVLNVNCAGGTCEVCCDRSKFCICDGPAAGFDIVLGSYMDSYSKCREGNSCELYGCVTACPEGPNGPETCIDAITGKACEGQ